jgi:hypothetical protein
MLTSGDTNNGDTILISELQPRDDRKWGRAGLKKAREMGNEYYVPDLAITTKS